MLRCIAIFCILESVGILYKARFFDLVSMSLIMAISLFTFEDGSLLIQCNTFLKRLNFFSSFSQIWQCGGQLVDAPCSRVGHIYRKFAPFSFGGSLGRVSRRNWEKASPFYINSNNFTWLAKFCSKQALSWPVEKYIFSISYILIFCKDAIMQFKTISLQ